MERLSEAERIVSAQIAGSAAAHGHLDRITADEAADEIRELLGRIPADRQRDVLTNAAAGYTAGGRYGDDAVLAVFVGLGVDVDEAAEVYRARHRYDGWHV